MRRRDIIRRAQARRRARHDYLRRDPAAHEADMAAWRAQVFAAARSVASRLPAVAAHDAEVIFDAGPRRWWRMFRPTPPVVGWQVASFKFWEPDPEGRAVPAYAPGSIWVDVHRRWVAVIGLADWMVIQADPAHLAALVPGEVIVDALAAGVPEVARRYRIQIPRIAPQPE